MIPTETEILHFLEIYSTRHFTRAAVKLGIAQPTLTQSIARLEEKIKTKLFIRTKQGCIPNRSAELLYERAIRLQEAWREIHESVSCSHDSPTGIFRIGCHQSVGAYTLPSFLKKLMNEAPQIKVRLHHDVSRRITEKIINHEIDLGFVVNPVKHRDLVLVKLCTDIVAFWRAKDRKPQRRLFADVNLLQVQTLLGKKSFARFSEWEIVESSSLELIRTLIVQGAGIGILPERVANVEGTQLEILSVDLPTFHDEIYLAYRVNTLKGAAGKALLSAARSCIS